MKIAITGATGFVGRELARQAEAAGHVVVPIVRGATHRCGEIITGNLETADITALARGLTGVDAVVHLAARTHVLRDHGDMMTQYHHINVTATDRLLQAITAAGVKRLIFMSSIKVNGEETRPGNRFSGNDLPQPLDDYGRTKHEAEQLICAVASRTGLQTVVLRPPMIYGPCVGGNFARLLAAVRRGMPLPFGRINNRRSLISVRNLADATMLALTASDVNGAVLTLCDGEDVSTRRLVEAIGQAIGRRARLLPVPPTALKMAGLVTGRGEEVRRLLGNLQVDSAAAREQLGWTPVEQLETALTRMFGVSGGYDSGGRQ
jgi:nucleoside-diphosphate-sugar epimerase